METRAYLDSLGRRPFDEWFTTLNSPAAAKVLIAISRMEHGNFSNAKAVGAGVWEYRIDFGPGYRIYFARDGDLILIFLGGGTKARQSHDIAEAKECWADYRRRKKREMH